MSGTGLHIIGRARDIPEHHRKRVKVPDTSPVMEIEVYTRKRFVALTGTEARGCWETDCTEQLRAFIDKYLGWDIPRVTKETAWTTEAVPGTPAWSDDELLEKALKSSSAHAVSATG